MTEFNVTFILSRGFLFFKKPYVKKIAVAKGTDLLTAAAKAGIVINAACGGDGKIERVPGEAAWKCANPDSFEQQKRKFYYFVSKHCFDIDGLGEKTIQEFYDEGWLHSPADLFQLPKREAEIADMRRDPEYIYGPDVLEMRLCEVTHLILRPNQKYIFTVDETCEGCVKAAAAAAGETSWGAVGGGGMGGGVPA